MHEPPSPSDRLAWLRKADPQHAWHSLDDQRVCAFCKQVITGREIALTHERDGGVVAHCPTPGCEATAESFLYYARASAEEGKPSDTAGEFSFL